MKNFRVDCALLRKHMIDKGYYSASSLADATGIRRETLSHLLNGQTLRPQTRVCYAIASALDLSSAECGHIFFAKRIANP